MRNFGWNVVLTLVIIIYKAECDCPIPKHFQGDFYSYERGIEHHTLINDEVVEVDTTEAKCRDVESFGNSTDALGRFNARILYFSQASNCYICHELYFRSANILQYKKASCRSPDTTTGTLADVCSDISPNSELMTLFRKELEIVNCKQTFEGVFQFSYEVNFGGGGICDNSESVIKACQEPGSPYVDNQVFEMNFHPCKDVTSSSYQRIRFQCMGTWRDEETGNIFSAVADLGRDQFRERFRCMLTRLDQQRSDNKKLYTLSRWAQCSTLNSPYEGPIRLVLFPVVYRNQLIEPRCNLPRNFTGTWFTTGEFDTDVTINSTHIYFKTKLDEYTYQETYFSCQQTRDSRYLMSTVAVGKCEIDYICFDFVPRHENLIRWRMGKPYRMLATELGLPDHLERKFRQTCTWSSFTIDRNDIEWTYNTFILNPPSPVDCPLGGRYQFEQTGSDEEKYYTRIRGITRRPRHMIDCKKYVTEFKSCDDNPKKIFIDAEYCDTVDHTGRPIGEYDEPDRELICVGHWLEDMKSYLITYDEEDAVSQFRCWVYERLDWRDMIISRATRSQCGRGQTARSYLPEEGASLQLELKESERLFDTCPQRYDTGADPYQMQSKIYVLGNEDTRKSSAAALTTVLSGLLCLVCVTLPSALAL